MEKPRIGFDLSRVIIEGNTKRRPDFLLNGNIYLPRALSILASIVVWYGADNVFIVSRVKDDGEEERVRQWLVLHGFYAKTRVLPEHVLLCRERSEKREFCQQYGLDIFVDDRLEVLGQIADVVSRLILFQGREPEIQKDGNKPYQHLLEGGITHVNSWDDIAFHLLYLNASCRRHTRGLEQRL